MTDFFLNSKVRKVIVVDNSTILIEIEGPSTYPEIGPTWFPSLKVECRVGFANEWLDMMGFPDEIVEYIDRKQGVVKREDIFLKRKGDR